MGKGDIGGIEQYLQDELDAFHVNQAFLQYLVDFFGLRFLIEHFLHEGQVALEGGNVVVEVVRKGGQRDLNGFDGE